MMVRALYLKKAIDVFLIDGNQKILGPLKLSASEWEGIELLASILLPFKVFSQRHQSTARPRIDQVFWTYETLFNRLDQLDTKIRSAVRRGQPHAANLQTVLSSMREKLSEYYA
jgi:hypothetical protein